MNKDEFYRKLEELIELDPGTITGATELSTLEAWDSVAVVSFIALADAEYGAVIPPKGISGAKTAGDLAALVAQHSESN